MGSIGDSITSVGDLYPVITMKWNSGVHYYMTYLTGDIPVGAYDPSRIANLGIGHGAIDAGGGYTYLNPASGQTVSGVAGFTYNFKNPDTQVQSGVDFHFDWSAAQFLSKQTFVGFFGYAYQQVSDDTGGSPLLGGFRSCVLGIGPQIAVYLSRRRHAGIFQLEGIRGIRCCESAVRLEYVGDIRDLAGRANGCNTDQASRDEVAISVAIGIAFACTLLRSSARNLLYSGSCVSAECLVTLG
jgi:Putative MetA-pathway of phenol degradation